MDTRIIKDKMWFKEKLDQQITKGNEILETNPQNSEEYEALANELDKWHKYNLDLLETSFEVQSNKYLKEYRDCTFKFELSEIERKLPSWNLGYDQRDNHKKTIEILKGKQDIRTKYLSGLIQRIELMKVPESILNGNERDSITDELKELIRKNKFGTVFDKLNTIIPIDYQNPLVILEARYNQYKKQIIIGTIQHSQNEELNQIRVGLLNIIDHIKDQKN